MMNAQDIDRYLAELGTELLQQGITGDIVLVGGAVMLLVLGSRPTTRDIDAYFSTHAQEIRDAAQVVALRYHLPSDWINDAVKGFFYTPPPTTLWKTYPGLRVYTATLEYVLALKALAARAGDIPDIQALAAQLGLTTASQVLAVVVKYVPQHALQPKVQYLIQSLFP